MKRFFAILLTLVMLTSLCACDFKFPEKYRGELNLSYITEADINYNNNVNFLSRNFFVAKDLCLYTTVTEGGEYFCLSKDGKKIALFNIESVEGEGFDYHSFSTLNNRLYFSTYLYDDETAVTSVFYDFDFATKQFTEHLRQDEVIKWLALQNGLLYSCDDDRGDRSLYYYNFDKKEFIAGGVYEFSVINGKVRYVVYNNEYVLYEYDIETKATKKLGAFSNFNSLASLEFYFTADALVFADTDKLYYSPNGSYFVLDINSGEITENNIPQNIENFAVADKYAFALTRDYTNPFKEKAALYLIELKTGKATYLNCEKPEDISSVIAQSDSVIYLKKYIDNPFSYSTSSVSKYDVTTQQTTELFKY